MTERQKSLLALLIVTLALLLIGLIEAFATEPVNSEIFFEQVARTVGDSLRGRDGIVIWIDRSTQEKKIFGNERLLQAYFLPGSLMKLITAEAATQEGLRRKYHCTGQDRIGGKLRHCWTHKGHGLLDLPQALGKSCNLYFAKLAQQLGRESLISVLKSYSFNQGRKFSQDLKSSSWDLVQFAIGDTPGFQVTPLEMVEFWNQFLSKIRGPNFLNLRQGLRRAASEGTARLLETSDLDLLAKTGTADSQVPSYKTHGWFLGAYPAQDPRYALVIFLKDAHGYREPTQLATEIFTLAREIHK